MKVIVGLGNPGDEYRNTRHNAGFSAVARIATNHGTTLWKKDFQAEIQKLRKGTTDVLLVRPQTYMNRSGEAVSAIVRYFRIDPQDLLVISDDLDLPLGKLRIRAEGSDGGQRGLRSIITHLSTTKFPRIRIGIGRDERMDVKDYVLGKGTLEQQAQFSDALDQAAEAAWWFVDHPLSDVMNRYNTRKDHA